MPTQYENMDKYGRSVILLFNNDVSILFEDTRW